MFYIDSPDKSQNHGHSNETKERKNKKKDKSEKTKILSTYPGFEYFTGWMTEVTTEFKPFLQSCAENGAPEK